MTDAELIARLRSDHPDHLTSAAADRIEALIVTAALVRGQREKLTVALAETEAKLAKAVEALRMVANIELTFLEECRDIARATLAEIKGESHE